MDDTRDISLPTAIENFCVRFAAGAGTAYIWTLEHGCILALLPPPHPAQDWAHAMCPLSAQATLAMRSTWLHESVVSSIQCGRALGPQI